jgi:hypothetical protein
MDHKKQFEILYTERQGSIDQTWDLIEQYFCPMRGGNFFQTNRTESENTFRRPRIYSDVPISASDNLASTLHGNLTSSVLQWFEFKFRDPRHNFDNRSRAWLELCARQVFHALMDSNFDLEISEAYLDLVHFGNAGIITEKEGDEFVFSTIPIRELYFTSDHRGRVVRCYRLHQWTAEQILLKFPDTTPDHVRDRVSDPTVRIDVIQAIYTRAASPTGPALPHERPVGELYFLRDTGEALAPEGGYYSMPVAVARWRKMSSSRWGHGPSALALPTAMTLNELVSLSLDNAEKAVSPANLATPNGLLSDLDLGPDGLTMVTDVNNSIKPYESRARFDVGTLEISRLEDSINRLFLVDRLALKESPAMTATEVSARIEKMARLLGSTLARIQGELLVPIIERVFKLIDKPPKPQSVKDDDYDIYFTGPLPRAMRRDVTVSMLGLLDSVAQAGQVMPELMDALHPQRFSQYLAYASGVPAEVLRTTEELEEYAEQKAQAQQQAMQLEMMKAAPSPTPGGIQEGFA